MTKSIKPGQGTQTVHESWAEYEAVVRLYVPEEAVIVLRTTFYAGIAACLNSPRPMQELAEYMLEHGKNLEQIFVRRH